MKKAIIIPVLLAGFTSCGVTRLTDLVNESSYAIEENINAVNRSTQVIQQNEQLIAETNKAIEANRNHLEKISKE